MRHFLSTCLLFLSHPSWAAVETPKESATYSTHTARRERNLDHWDADTLAYYLGLDVDTAKPLDKDNQYAGQDAAVLFYAQWCRNCHALAPSWDAIATHLGAGTIQSNLIMALFDCEANYQHMQLCTAAGVKHYPTMLFIGAGPYHDTDLVSKTILGKDKSAGPAGAAPLKHTVKFQGNWNYVDSVLDWIRLMQGLSRWHKWTTHGFLRFMREGLLGLLLKRKPKAAPQSLPVGIPLSQGSSGGGIQETTLLEKKLSQAKEETEHMSKLATHASLLINSVLFPPHNKTSSGYVDVFAKIDESKAWDDKVDPELQVLKTCVMELTLDYCTRLTTAIATDYVDTVPESEYPSMAEIEKLFKERIKEQEPYCDVLETCIAEEFKSEVCRPATCPLKQDTACRYLAACTDNTIQKEYAVVLGYIKEKETWPPPKKKEAAPRDAASGGGGWMGGSVKDDIDQIKV